jgi:hypothetical protein
MSNFLRPLLRTLLAAGLVLTAGTAHAQITRIGPTFPTISSPVRGSAVAYDPVNKVYLTVASNGTVFGRFVTEDGAALGSSHFAIQASGIFGHFPGVAYSPHADGGAGAFLVVWHESDLVNWRTSIHARLVSFTRGGAFGNDVQVAAAASFPEASVKVDYSPAAGKFLVVWGTDAGVPNVNGVIVSNTVAPGAIIPIGASGDGELKPGVACHATSPECLVSYSGWGSIGAFARSILVNMSTESAVEGTRATLQATAGTYQTDAVYNSGTGEYLVLWYEDPAQAIFGRRVSAGSGTEAGSVIPISSYYAAKDSVDAAYNPASGRVFLIAMGKGTYENGGVDINGSGTPGSPVEITVTGNKAPGNYYPTVGAHASRPEWLTATSVAQAALYAQRVASGSTGGGSAPPPPSAPAICSTTFSKSSESFGPLGGGGAFTLTTGDSCAWTAGTNAGWLTLASSSISGTGSKTLSYSVAANTSKESRTAILYSGNRSLTVTQAGRGTRTSDFNSDGLNDLVWQNRMTGELSVWRMKGINIVSGDYLSPGNVGDSNWKIVGTFDANLDGQTDLLFQHDAGYVAIWRMSGDTRVEAVMLGSSVVSEPRWRIVATGDMDRDGFGDIIWQHADGRVAVWYMYGDGYQIREGVEIAAVSDSRWRVAGIEDMNRDGKLDILWRHSASGDMTIWHMDDRRYLSSSSISLSVSNMQWEIAALGDFSGDGKADLIWRNNVTGELAAWFMDGNIFLNGWSLNPGRVADTNWRITGPR